MSASAWSEGVRIRAAHKRFGDEVVFDGLTCDFLPRTTYAVIGRSGVGKTTLMNMLLGLVKPDAGRVEGLRGVRVSAVFQEDRLIEHLSARRNLALVCGRGAREERICELLREMGLQEAGERPVRAFSGGMRRRVALARALIAPSDMLLLDEPFKGLDEETLALVSRVARREAGGRLTVLIAHDLREARLMGATKTLLIAGGKGYERDGIPASDWAVGAAEADV